MQVLPTFGVCRMFSTNHHNRIGSLSDQDQQDPTAFLWLHHRSCQNTISGYFSAKSKAQIFKFMSKHGGLRNHGHFISQDQEDS